MTKARTSEELNKGGSDMWSIGGKNRRRLTCWSVVGAIVAIPLAATACSSGATWSASFSSITPISTAEARVVINIKNTGGASGTPFLCAVSLFSPGHANVGFDVLHPEGNINPGATVQRTATITVTNNGAHQVTESDSEVDCF